jgi:hypothetical protein
MVDSRAKGARAESAAKDILIRYTKLGWERTPGSGALDEKHKLKGDLYLPDCKNNFCVEVKHYKDDHLTSKILTDKNPQILEWWDQAVRQGLQVDREPLLLFKFDRSKWFVAFNCHALKTLCPKDLAYRFIEFTYSDEHPVFIAKLEDWLIHEEIQWTS